MMGGSVPPAQAGLTDQSDRNDQVRQNNGGRGNVIGGDASAKTSMGSGGGSSGGGGGSSGGGGGGGAGGYSLGASVAGTQTTASGQSGDVNTGNKGIKNTTRNGPVFNYAGKGAKLTTTTGLSGTVIAMIVVGVAILGMAAYLMKRKS